MGGYPAQVPDIFVSYASEDRERIRPLVDALAAGGWSVWWDRQIGVGTTFDQEIEQALDTSRCVVVAWSTDSVASEWVRTEAHEGLDRGVLVPVRLDDVKPPLAFRRKQCVDLYDVGVTGLVSAVSALIGAAQAVSMAVLPFRDRSSGQAYQFLVDGLAEDLMVFLARTCDIRVAPRSDTFRFRGDAIETAEVAANLGVRYVLEGSIQVAGQRIRITVELIDAASGFQTWSKRAPAVNQRGSKGRRRIPAPAAGQGPGICRLESPLGVTNAAQIRRRERGSDAHVRRRALQGQLLSVAGQHNHVPHLRGRTECRRKTD